MADRPFANYHEQRRQFGELGMAQCPNRTVFLEGTSSVGKTYLLDWLDETVQAPARFLMVDLATPSQVPEPLVILSVLARRIDPLGFATLNAHLADVGKRRQAIISNVTVTGDNNVFTASTGETDQDRLLVAAQATALFFTDLAAVTARGPVILAFDGFSPAMKSLNDWFDLIFIAAAADHSGLRLILCGQEIPEQTLKRRSKDRISVRLDGIREPEEWLALADILSLKIPGATEGERKSYLQGMIAITSGRPGLMMPVLRLPGNGVA